MLLCKTASRVRTTGAEAGSGSFCNSLTRLRAASVALFFFSFISISSAVWGQGVELTVYGDGEERRATLELVDIEGVAYLNLPVLMEHVGGAYNMLPVRLRVDFSGTTAWLTVDDNRVHALSIFSLAHSIREENGVALIALDDVAPFFLKSFRARVEFEMLDTGGTAETEPGPPLLDPKAPGEADRTEIATIPNRIPAGPITIIVDAGHGGYDLGLESEAGFLEKDIVLDVALRLKALMDTSGLGTAVLTRSEDIGLTVAQRAQIVRASQADILITLHASGAMSRSTRGASILYVASPPQAARAALVARSDVSGRDAVHPDIGERSRILAGAVGQSLSGRPGVSVRGARSAPVRLLSEVMTPGILVEVGCLTNASEANALGTEDYRGELAEGIFEGVISYANSLSTPTAPVGELDLRSVVDF